MFAVNEATMSERNFMQMLKARWERNNFVCVGLDSEYEKIPKVVRERSLPWKRAIVDFNRAIVNATKDFVCAYKPNSAFYEACGAEGVEALHETIAHIGDVAPEVPVILDAKRGDTKDTNIQYAKMAFVSYGADAITVNPYMGREPLEPFLSRKDKGVIVLCRTSNEGASEFQDRTVVPTAEEAMKWGIPIRPMPLYQLVAYRVVKEWNANGNCAVVVGATCPAELDEVSQIVSNMPILIPGIGAQGGNLEKTVKAGKDSHGAGMIINSSRGIIFASNGADFATVARRETEKLHNLINQYRK